MPESEEALSQVSRTAILTLICRAVETERRPAEFSDPLAGVCLERLMQMASEHDRRWMARERRLYAGFHERDARAQARRAKTFDLAANRFIADHAECTVVNLGCGFDTRFWRIDSARCRYIELDLPPVIALKRAVLKGYLGYELISGSVLDLSWIDTVTASGHSAFLLLAEGLFMYLPERGVARLLGAIGERFSGSRLMLDVTAAKYTRGLWKQLLRLDARLTWGMDMPAVSGTQDARDLECCSSALKVIAEEKGFSGPIITLAIGAG